MATSHQEMKSARKRDSQKLENVPLPFSHSLEFDQNHEPMISSHPSIQKHVLQLVEELIRDPMGHLNRSNARLL